MEEIVKRIGAIPGIIEIFLSDREGRLLASSLKEERGEEEVAKVSSILARSIFGLEGIGERVEEIEVNFKKEKALIKNLQGGILCLFHSQKINPVLLRLSTGLQILDLKNRLQGGETPSSQKPQDGGDEEWWMVLERELKRAIGPIAGHILEEKRVNLRGPLDARGKENIVEELLGEIPTEEKREEFKRETLKGAE